MQFSSPNKSSPRSAIESGKFENPGWIKASAAQTRILQITATQIEKATQRSKNREARLKGTETIIWYRASFSEENVQIRSRQVLGAAKLWHVEADRFAKLDLTFQLEHRLAASFPNMHVDRTVLVAIKEKSIASFGEHSGHSRSGALHYLSFFFSSRNLST